MNARFRHGRKKIARDFSFGHNRGDMLFRSPQRHSRFRWQSTLHSVAPCLFFFFFYFSLPLRRDLGILYRSITTFVDRVARDYREASDEASFSECAVIDRLLRSPSRVFRGLPTEATGKARRNCDGIYRDDNKMIITIIDVV